MKKENIEEIKKQIVIERLRQTPSTVKISFGASSGDFMNRDQMIEQVEKGTDIGKNIIKIQLEYLRSFKENTLAGD